MLHITNGDATANLLRRTGLTGTVLAWRDILHEGPVPAGLSLEKMSEVRARFLSSYSGAPFPDVWREFGARDAALRAARNVVLWFEHDLYDQLQLIQILATLATQRETSAELICVGAFPGVEPFFGLGQLTPVQLASLSAQRRPVTSLQLAAGARAWKAFGSADPIAIRRVLASDLSPLPFLADALRRHLEEFPAAPDGLSRTERQILQAVAGGCQTFEAIFRASQQQETAPYLGDSTLKRQVDALTSARVPLLTREPITLTAAGQRVLSGETDARTLNGIDRWLGGVHLVA